MRAGRLVQMLRLLETRGQLTAGALAAELEVSRRTILRDIGELSSAGVPVYAVRGPRGGFALLTSTSAAPAAPPGWGMRLPLTATSRAVIELSPVGRQMAMLNGRPAGLRVRRSRRASDPDWIEASFPMSTPGGALHELLALGAEVTVLRPLELRAMLAEAGRTIAARNAVDRRAVIVGARSPVGGRDTVFRPAR